MKFSSCTIISMASCLICEVVIQTNLYEASKLSVMSQIIVLIFLITLIAIIPTGYQPEEISKEINRSISRSYSVRHPISISVININATNVNIIVRMCVMRTKDYSIVKTTTRYCTGMWLGGLEGLWYSNSSAFKF